MDFEELAVAGFNKPSPTSGCWTARQINTKTMEDTFKKILYTGIGFLSLAKEKTQEVINDLIDRGKLSQEEGERIMNDFKKESATSREAMEKEMKSWLENTLDRMDIAQKKDLEKLQLQLTDLQKRVTALEGPEMIQ